MPVGLSSGSNDEHAAALRTLASKRSMLESELAVRQTEVGILDGASREAVQRWSPEMDMFMDTFVQRERAAQSAVLEIQEQIAVVKIMARAVLGDASKGEVIAVTTVTLCSEQEGSAELQLTYGECRCTNAFIGSYL